MKRIMNITTCGEDLLRYRDNADLRAFLRSFDLDGLEVLQAGDDLHGILTAEDTVGVHLRYFAAWMDLWTGNEERLLEEFGSRDVWQGVYGGDGREALIRAFRENIRFANTLRPEYLVFHVSECTMAESMRRRYHYSDEQVIDAAIELVNSICDEIEGEPWLLFENLWYPGLTMLRPEMTERLLQGVRYPKCGIMLDIGHLMHTNTALRSADEAVDYFHTVLDRLGDLSSIKGVHLHQSLSGAYAEELMQTWQPAPGPYHEQMWSIMGHIFTIDTHRPFTSPRIREVLDRLPLAYLVLEQITADRAEHEQLLAQQTEVLNR